MFGTVSLDPPWLERGAGKIKRGADRHYPLMKVGDILDLVSETPEWDQIATDAHCYMWVTNNFLQDGLWLMKELGFRYVTNIAWVKIKNSWPQSMMDSIVQDEILLSPESWLAVTRDAVKFGIGQYFRGAHELCLFGTSGKCQKPKKALPSAFLAPRSEHSKKPEYIYQLIEQTSPGPYLEMFARTHRPGWDCWGNEVNK
jgi:N6-adenosine-specific RNA methylase IME4